MVPRCPFICQFSPFSSGGTRSGLDLVPSCDPPGTDLLATRNWPKCPKTPALTPPPFLVRQLPAQSGVTDPPLCVDGFEVGRGRSGLHAQRKERAGRGCWGNSPVALVDGGIKITGGPPPATVYVR